MKLAVYREHHHVERDPYTGRKRKHPDTVTWKVLVPPGECDASDRVGDRPVFFQRVVYSDFLVLCKNRDIPNAEVLARRIAELAFPELHDIEYIYANKLPNTPWHGVPPECFKSEIREVWIDLDYLPEEWLKQKPRKTKGDPAHVKAVLTEWRLRNGYL